MSLDIPVLLDLTEAQAVLFRRYKQKVLNALNIKEALYCYKCGEAGRADGVRASVTDTQISIRCRCTHRVYTKS
jgi:hypothetical protein